MNHAVRSVDLCNEAELEQAFRVFTFLRPELDLAAFRRRIQAQVPEGYRVVAIEQDGRIAALAGYRIAHFLAWGRVLYLDDLATHPDFKRQGLGGALLDWLRGEASRLECDELHLDTGYGRHDAHRLYLNKGFSLAAHHVSVKLKPASR